MSVVVSIYIGPEDVGRAGAWLSESVGPGAFFNIDLAPGAGSVSITGRVAAAVALRDALNAVIGQAEALTGGQP